MSVPTYSRLPAPIPIQGGLPHRTTGSPDPIPIAHAPFPYTMDISSTSSQTSTLRRNALAPGGTSSDQSEHLMWLGASPLNKPPPIFHPSPLQLPPQRVYQASQEPPQASRRTHSTAFTSPKDVLEPHTHPTSLALPEDEKKTSPEPYHPNILRASRERQQTAKPHLLLLQVDKTKSRTQYLISDSDRCGRTDIDGGDRQGGDVGNGEDEEGDVEMLPYSPRSLHHLVGWSERVQKIENPTPLAPDAEENDPLAQRMSETGITDRNIPVIICHSPTANPLSPLHNPLIKTPKIAADPQMIKPPGSRSIRERNGENEEAEKPNSSCGSLPGEFTPSLGALMGSAGDVVRRSRNFA